MDTQQRQGDQLGGDPNNPTEMTGGSLMCIESCRTPCAVSPSGFFAPAILSA